MQSTSVLYECKFQLFYQQHHELENDILGKTERAVEVATWILKTFPLDDKVPAPTLAFLQYYKI